MVGIEREVVQVEEPETANTIVTGSSEDYCLQRGDVLSAYSRDNWTNQWQVPAEVHIAAGFPIPYHATKAGSSFHSKAMSMKLITS
jgi:hypothetical protein